MTSWCAPLAGARIHNVTDISEHAQVHVGPGAAAGVRAGPERAVHQEEQRGERAGHEEATPGGDAHHRQLPAGTNRDARTADLPLLFSAVVLLCFSDLTHLLLSASAAVRGAPTLREGHADARGAAAPGCTEAADDRGGGERGNRGSRNRGGWGERGRIPVLNWGCWCEEQGEHGSCQLGVWGENPNIDFARQLHKAMTTN